jgi:predicted AAA+ superfamily ATPase
MCFIMYTRNSYIDSIIPFIGKPVVKVIAGMRRSGKSCIVRLLIEKLRHTGIPGKQIVYVDKESYEFDSIRDYHDLAKHVATAREATKGVLHVFIDEIQEIENWERIVADWSGKSDMDVTITGSNAHLLSGELATLLSGRHVEFHIYTLSFAEFRQFHRLESVPLPDAFSLFLRYGGLPGLHAFGPLSDSTFQPFVTGVYNTIMLKDVVKRHQVRNVALLETVSRFLFDNIGNLTNASRINAFLKHQKRSISVDTILNYMQWFADAHLTHRVQLYEIKGRRHLEVNEKHYVNDLGLRTAILGYRADDIGGMLENIVYLELIRRGYRVSVGRIGDNEIDFVAERHGHMQYIQVAYLLPSRKTLERETKPLLAIDDNYPKFLLTLDQTMGTDYKACNACTSPTGY